ncbi:MAG: terminase family protein [Bryobacteraceae bacterium]|nr:terminase family protein [Bryobacteraceae bacterium]
MLKSYDQRRESFQGTEQDVIWLDEEPPLDLYTECLMRTMTTGGTVMLAFTPLRGLSDVVLSFQREARSKGIPSLGAGAIDPAARGRSQVDGRQLLQMYTDLGLRVAMADNAVEAGIYRVWQRLSSGRLKVFQSLEQWRSEFRLYRRDEKGRVVNCDRPDVRHGHAWRLRPGGSRSAMPGNSRSVISSAIS